MGSAGFLLAVTLLISHAFAESIIQISPHRKTRVDDGLYCDSWRFSVETNNAGVWYSIPSRCIPFVEDYMNGDRYLSDSQVVSSYGLDFANTVNVSSDGKDAWVFDIDETLLSNLPYYDAHGFGSEIFDEDSFDEWVDLAEAPALPASLKLYNELKQLGFKIFLLTGRSEFQRNVTGKNLLFSGYSGWEKLILRGPQDQGKLAVVYKSEKRQELVNEGYRIHGSSGDQWSDLQGFAVAERSFKLPNPMYFIA
uniref:Vegetative storage protein 2-like protein VSP2-2 n=1 Tax=Dimocarpus longan TaxID=128017 RepID=A0A0F6RAM5_9ROSI|nr:vegetative storage protein 2-like protein VSP2-2 [Dimocarpus longan]